MVGQIRPINGRRTEQTWDEQSCLHVHVPVNGDAIVCEMTSNAACASPQTATSNTITMTVNLTVTPSVFITSNPSSPICAGTSVTFTAVPMNGGSNPIYQWKKNGAKRGDEQSPPNAAKPVKWRCYRMR